MFESIAAQSGVVNQMIGDGLMALFSTAQELPETALAAAQTGLNMIEMIELLNTKRIAASKGPIAIGIGIASGEMIAGHTGTQDRATYTCIGDTVNLAARLKAHTKIAKRAILVDQETNKALAGRLLTDALGPEKFKGKAEAVDVFALGVTS